ncbi:hypothetical protein AB3X52_18730 [Nocardioides sp. DS6]|uniref:Antitoxin n=1 Tax=Nocardioides eburneus TaxID=3231482 RepID=A0ABV3T3C6_9ACTN
MRTTVTLDPDVEQLLRERMAAKGVSFKEALNEAVRESATPRVDYVFESPSRPMGWRWKSPEEFQEAMAAAEDTMWLDKLARSR